MTFKRSGWGLDYRESMDVLCVPVILESFILT